MPGSPTVVIAKIVEADRDLIRSLALLEGCMPVDHLKPIMHHYVHYGAKTAKFGILSVVWMMCFERYNKHLKNHVRHAQYPDINLAHTASQTDTAFYYELLEDMSDLPDDLYHR